MCVLLWDRIEKGEKGGGRDGGKEGVRERWLNLQCIYY